MFTRPEHGTFIQKIFTEYLLCGGAFHYVEGCCIEQDAEILSRQIKIIRNYDEIKQNYSISESRMFVTVPKTEKSVNNYIFNDKKTIEEVGHCIAFPSSI